METWGNHFRYQNQNINERDLHSILVQSQNKQIIGLVGKAKDAKAMQYIGFGAIPLGIGAMYFLANSTIGNASYLSQNNNSGNYLMASTICFIGAITCPIASRSFRQKRTMNNLAAIKLFNEK